MPSRSTQELREKTPSKKTLEMREAARKATEAGMEALKNSPPYKPERKTVVSHRVGTKRYSYVRPKIEEIE
jgi:hypothetical protein